jgi:hypothetical protein
VKVPEEVAEPGGVTVGGGARVTDPVTLSVIDAARLLEPDALAVAVRVPRPVADPEAEPVTVTESCREPVTVLEPATLSVPLTLREGVADPVDVLDCVELRVPVSDVFSEREIKGEDVPVFEDVIVRVAVPEAVGLRVMGPLRVPVTEAVDVLDWEIELVPVVVKRTDRLRGGEREGEVELEAVLEPRAE